MAEKHSIRTLLLTVIFVLTCGGTVFAQTATLHTFATATTGGTYYPVGVALATLTKVKLLPGHNFALNAISSAGSAENIAMLRDKRADFAILQALYGAWAWNGTGKMKAAGRQDYLRSISMLWKNVEHFVIKSDFVRKGDMSDLANLRGRSFSLGTEGSGTEGSGQYILEQLGYRPQQDFQLADIDYGSTAVAIQEGTIDGMNIPAGPPVAAVNQACSALGKDITILRFSSAQLAAVNRDYPLWSRFSIAPGTYPGQVNEIETIAQPNFLAVRSDVDDETVYQIVKTIYANLDFLHIIHSATEALSLDQAIEGLPVPLHPGAARFYREQGIDIPDRLIVR